MGKGAFDSIGQQCGDGQQRNEAAQAAAGQPDQIALVAAHREWNSYNFYKGLAAAQPAGEVREMLLQMASQEMKHKEKVEYLYSNTAFPQTSGG